MEYKETQVAVPKSNGIVENKACNKNTFKLSHKKWRRLLKKERRKVCRQMFAQAKARLIEEETERIESDATLREKKLTELMVDKQKEKWNEYERKKLHLEWLKREKEAIEKLKKSQKDESKRIKDREEQEKRIKEEWEQQQKLESDKLLKEETAKKSHEDKLNKELEKSGILQQTKSDEWHNPFGTSDSTHQNEAAEQTQQDCSFFMKTGACRFGDRCSRHHERPSSSCTILIPNMFQDVRLSQSLLNEHDQDFALEYEDKDMYENFLQFYNDTISEFIGAGGLIQFKVCCNYEPHLRGNVYAQYTSEDQALIAFSAFNGRWYAGRQLSVQFSPVTKWKSAICGLFHQQKCPKGKNCNFLHVFRNPGNAFRNADRDFEPMSTRSDRSVHSERSNSQHNRWTPQRNHRHHSRSPDNKTEYCRRSIRREERRSSDRRKTHSPSRSHHSPNRSHNDTHRGGSSRRSHRYSEVEEDSTSSENESKKDRRTKKKKRQRHDDDNDDDRRVKKKSKRSKHKHSHDK